MKGVRYIPGKLYEVADPEPLPTSTAIVAEIAERLLELRELDATFPGKLLARLDRIWRANPRAFWTVLEVLSGDHANEKSLAEIAANSGTAKQNVAQTRKRDLAELERTFPEVADVLRQLFGRVSSSPSKTPPPA